MPFLTSTTVVGGGPRQICLKRLSELCLPRFGEFFFSIVLMLSKNTNGIHTIAVMYIHHLHGGPFNESAVFSMSSGIFPLHS